jgi:phosphate:Na+ symporter
MKLCGFTSNRKRVTILAFILASIFSTLSYGVNVNPPSIHWGMLVIGLLGGLALFLYGMNKLSEGMKKTAGNSMRDIIHAITKNRFMALIIGAFVTIVVQSSSATTVMLVSFVQAGLMTFTQSLGVILGADIGTTVTTQLIAFNFSDYALLIIAMGFGMHLIAGKEKLKNIGEIILGFGILFYGMKLMSDTMAPLRDYPLFIETMGRLKSPFMGLLAGTIFTGLIQSSAATAGIVIVLAQQGLITLETGIPIILGANIGTCVTAGLASINTSREAKRVAFAHVCFKILGVLIFIFWVPGFADLVRYISERFESDVARQIANAHTLFNVSLSLFFLPFITFFANVMIKIVPKGEKKSEIELKAKYLDDKNISSPAMAIELARRELSYMAQILSRMLNTVFIPFITDKKISKSDVNLSDEEKEALINEVPRADEKYPHLTLFEALDVREEHIDYLNDRIQEFLINISKRETTATQANEIYGLISISSDMESIADLIHRNLLKLIHKKNALERDFSEEGKEELMIYHDKVCRQIDRLADALSERSIEKAISIMGRERKYLDLEAQYRVKHLERVRHEKLDSVLTHEVHMELMDILKQIVVYTSNIAKTFLTKCDPDQTKEKM